jgi:hypothetical protein
MIDICRSLALLEGPAGDAGTLALIPADCSGHEIVTGRDARTVRNLKTVICENRSGLPRPAIERKDHRHDDTPSCERYSFSVVREREVVAARQKRVALSLDEGSVLLGHSLVLDAPHRIGRVAEVAHDVELADRRNFSFVASSHLQPKTRGSARHA